MIIFIITSIIAIFVTQKLLYFYIIWILKIHEIFNFIIFEILNL